MDEEKGEQEVGQSAQIKKQQQQDFRQRTQMF
jgi:hypothetical protein